MPLAWLGPAAAARMGHLSSSQMWPQHAKPGGQYFFTSEVVSGTIRLILIPAVDKPDNLLSVRAETLNKLLLALKTQSAGMTRKNNLQNRCF